MSNYNKMKKQLKICKQNNSNYKKIENNKETKQLKICKQNIKNNKNNINKNNNNIQSK